MIHYTIPLPIFNKLIEDKGGELNVVFKYEEPIKRLNDGLMYVHPNEDLMQFGLVKIVTIRKIDGCKYSHILNVVVLKSNYKRKTKSNAKSSSKR